MSSRDYRPPDADAMRTVQDEPGPLQLLIAQRRMYTAAKRWQGLRWWGVIVLAVGAPFVSILWPPAAVAAGAIAGVWLFVGRTVLTWLQARIMARAASTQEDFDLVVFGMPRTIEREAHPSVEDIVALGGTDQSVTTLAASEGLLGWYDFGDATGARAVAIAQRANAAYTDRLIRTTVGVWATVAGVWLAVLIIWSAVEGVSLSSFLLGVAFPVLPSVLDVTEYVMNTWKASRDRADLARTIEARLRVGSHPIDGQDLLVWQERMFELRRTTPQVPDWLYQLTRRRNEAAMRLAARRLS